MRKSWLSPRGLAQFDEAAWLFLRVLTGAFLIYGVWDNITSVARMQEFVSFLKAHHFVYPEIMARLSVWAQFFCGVAFVLGLLTRWAGLVCAINFIVGCAMVHWQQDFRAWWPATVLVAIGALMATRGSGKFGLDRWLLEDR